MQMISAWATPQQRVSVLMKPELHPDAQPVIDAFLANGGKSFEQVGDISALRSGYETNCGPAAMQGLEHIQSRRHYC